MNPILTGLEQVMEKQSTFATLVWILTSLMKNGRVWLNFSQEYKEKNMTERQYKTYKKVQHEFYVDDARMWCHNEHC